MRLLSALTITGLLATGGAVFMAVAPATSASAADLSNGVKTSFEIDGDTAGANDWVGVVGSTPKSAYTTASGHQSSGIVDAQRTSDSGADYAAHTCGAAETLSVFPGGAKINDNPWKTLITNSANAKGDACTGGSAYELVNVGGVEHMIFYAYWTRLSGNGDMTSYQVLEGPNPGRGDDFLIEFNYDPSGNPKTDINLLGWNGSSWVDTGTTVYFQAAVGANTDTNSSAGDNDTFGEFAIDLTASGLLPTDGSCRTLVESGFITRTGNKDTATLQDKLVSSDPLSLSNCGNLVVKKIGGTGPDATFGYTVARTGAGKVHDTTLTGPTDTVPGDNGLGAAIKIGDTHTWTNVFAGNDYKLTETTPPAPWVFKQTSCTVTNPTTGQVESATDGSFKMYVGATTTCTIENVTSGVKITKVAQGDPATFDFTVTGQPGNVQVPGNSSSQVFYYTPGSDVTIKEIAEPGTPEWSLQSIVCAPAGTIDAPQATATVKTVAGQVAECTFTNRQDGAIKIIKNVAGANGTFTFTTTGADIAGFDLTTVGGTATKDFTSVTPGQYTVTETTPAPAYDLTNLSCVEDVTNDSVVSIVDGKATINVQPGELVTCTYTNTQRGNIIVKKETNPDKSSAVFDFTLTGQPGFTLSDGGEKAFNNLKPGAFTLAELAKAGWDVTSMTCTGETPTTDSPIAITLSAGETVVCTVLNTATKGKVQVTKTAVGAADWAFDISISPTPGGQDGTKTVSDESPTVAWDDLDVGTQYTLQETGQAGWDEGPIVCTGLTDEKPDVDGFQFTVTPGLDLKCTVENIAQPGKVTVTKTVEGVASGTAWSFDLTIDPSAGVVPGATQQVTNADPTVEWTKLKVDETYTITETLPAGWTGGQVVCGALVDLEPNEPGFTFKATPGLSLDCTVKNTAKPATAKITKTAVGEGGTFIFVLDPIAPDGPAVEQSVVIGAGGGQGDTTFTGLVPGTKYSIAEKDPGSHWVKGTLVCTVKHADGSTAGVDESGFTVEPGDTFDCSITNTAKGTIVIVKNIDGADGTFNFTGTWLDPQAFSITTVGGTKSNTSLNVLAGKYTVTELLTNTHIGSLQCTDPDGGSSVAKLVGTIDLDPGETVTCTYSNTELGKIIVDKNVTFASDQEFDFDYFDDHDNKTSFSLTGTATPWESGLIEPGTYTVKELGEANWKLQSLQCTGSDGVSYDGPLATIVLKAGEVVTCTYVNAPDTGDVTVRKIVDGVPQGYPFDFAITISPAVVGQDATQHVTQADSSVSWNTLVVGQSYTLTEGDEAGWNEGAFVCNGGALADADPALAGFQFTVTPGLSISCTVTNTAVPGKVTVTKKVSGVPDGLEWSFPLTISPADGVAPVTDPIGQQTVSGTGNVTDTVTWTNLKIGTVYTVTEGTLPLGWSGGTVTCTDADPQTAGNQFTATPGASLSCEVTNAVVPPTGEITKELTSISQNAQGTWDLVYEVKVKNLSPVAPLVYDLSDQPFFGSGIVINTASAAGPSDAADDWDPKASVYTLADDESVPAAATDTYTITINATAAEVVFDTSQHLCQPGETTPGGFRNTAWLKVGDGALQPATACGGPGKAIVDKELIGSPVLGADGDWTVTYEVNVTNESAVHELYYDLEDDLGFPGGVEIVTATATNDASVDTTGWNGQTETTLADDVKIAKSAVHTYTIVVVADVDQIVEIDDAMCLETTSGHGFFNEAVLTNGKIETRDSDCDTIPIGRLTLEKHVDLSAFEGYTPEDFGLDPEAFEHLASKDWLLTGDGADAKVAVLGDAGTVFTVPIGDYALAEEPTVEGAAHPLLEYFFSQGWRCEVGGDDPAETDTATVELGELTSCELTNKAELVDVGIEKDYDLSGLPDDAIEGGDEFEYVLTVTNHSSIEVADLDVTDVVDPALEVTGPASFEGDGTWTEQPTIGDNAFAAHGVGPFEPGSVTTIRIPVKLPMPEPVEGGIVGPDDPAPPTPEIELGDVPNEACVKITEGEGVLPDLVKANDCDDVEVPRKAIDPAAYVRCIADVPWLYFNVAASEHVEPGDITVTWTSADGTLTKVETVAWEDRNDRLLWPGAAVDENGIPFEFPGWRPITEEDLTNPPTPGTRFGDLILDETVPTYPWRDMENPATITFSVNPSQSVLAVYPQALPSCEIEREPLVDILKTSSVTDAKPGTDFEYTLEVTATGVGTADPVEVFDEIPSQLRVDAITTAPSPAFPRWENCEVTGKDASGYGGLLHCELLGVLGPNFPAAPPIVLDVHLNEATKSTSVENTGEVCWQNADDTSEDPVVVCDDSKVTVRVPQPMAVTGFAGQPFVWGAAGLVLLGGLLVAAGIAIRRRKQGEHTA
ncbi:collagen binding domain-containing protein [Agromyces sp. NPDC058136]|uniref:MSCRAMM family protein n=1 Tax=Agromyces sp. NPDC058136 TaxID=3346354 RepID=UPI0036D92623